MGFRIPEEMRLYKIPKRTICEIRNNNLERLLKEKIKENDTESIALIKRLQQFSDYFIKNEGKYIG